MAEEEEETPWLSVPRDRGGGVSRIIDMREEHAVGKSESRASPHPSPMFCSIPLLSFLLTTFPYRKRYLGPTRIG